MNGESDGVRLLCKSCARPDPAYFDVPLDWFVGRSVKIGFRSEDGHTENMWVVIDGVDGTALVGVLNNDPILVDHLRVGDRVSLERTQIMAVEPSQPM